MYENSRFLKNKFTFGGVNTNFGQQWAPPAYYHLTPIVSKGKHCCSSVAYFFPCYVFQYVNFIFKHNIIKFIMVMANT